MIHRACNLPLAEESLRRELNYIKDTAVVNGYSEDMVDRLFRKHSKQRRLSEATTLTPLEKEKDFKWAGLIYHPSLSFKIANVLRKFSIRAAPKTTEKLSRLLKSPKDATDELEKAGIYKICCETCPALYIGQTKRNIGQRFKEHMWDKNKGDNAISSVAKPINQNPTHIIKTCDITLLRQ